MSEPVVVSFRVVAWDQAPPEDADVRPLQSRAIVTKQFEGALEGQSTAELLMCQADPEDLSLGAGYVASETFSGTFEGRSGTFVMQHHGISGGGEIPRSAGHIVPGSATGDLEGLRANLKFGADGQGAHTLELDVLRD